jgi:hypothetical protein
MGMSLRKRIVETLAARGGSVSPDELSELIPGISRIQVLRAMIQAYKSGDLIRTKESKVLGKGKGRTAPEYAIPIDSVVVVGSVWGGANSVFAMGDRA